VGLDAGIARLGAAEARTLVRDALAWPAEGPAPHGLLRGDAWSCATTAIDPEGWRAVLVTTGTRAATARTCVLADPTGEAVATFAADDAARRAAAAQAALAVERLAVPGPQRLGLLGAGALGRAVVAALRDVVELEAIAAHDPAGAGDLRAVADAATATSGATVIVTAASARDPVLRADWVPPGATVVAIGADRPGRRELDYRVVADAALVACDAPRAAAILADDLREPVADGHLDWQEVTPLADLVGGDVEGRVGAEDRLLVKLVDPTPGVLALARAALARGGSRRRSR
jgi:ornithine cyclodeaminase/alanine dehydrogenase-like protein (mu-crystallin family)